MAAICLTVDNVKYLYAKLRNEGVTVEELQEDESAVCQFIFYDLAGNKFHVLQTPEAPAYT